MVAGEHRAEPAEAVDHLVGHHQHVVAPAHGLDLLPIGGGRGQHAARADQRLADEGRDRFGSFREDLRLELGGEPVREGLLGLARLGIAVVVRAGDVLHLRQRQVEAAVVGGQAREAAGRDRDAVVAVLPRDELLLLGPADRVVVEPHELDDCVVGFRARIGEEHAVEPRRRHLHQPLGEVDGGLGGLAREGVVIGQAAHLPGGRSDEARLAEPDRDAPQPRHGLDIFLAGVVVDVDPAAPRHHDGPGPLVLAGVGGGWSR